MNSSRPIEHAEILRRLDDVDRVLGSDGAGPGVADAGPSLLSEALAALRAAVLADDQLWATFVFFGIFDLNLLEWPDYSARERRHATERLRGAVHRARRFLLSIL